MLSRSYLESGRSVEKDAKLGEALERRINFRMGSAEKTGSKEFLPLGSGRKKGSTVIVKTCKEKYEDVVRKH